MWLLDPGNLEELQLGRWPTDGSSTDIKACKLKPEAYFEIPCGILAELEMRIERCGRHGKIYTYRFIDGHSVRETENHFRIGKDEVYRISRRVLKYIIGRNRRTADYRQWTRKEREKRQTIKPASP